MPPKSQRSPQDVTPATLSTIRPGTPVVPLNPQEEETLNEVARMQGVDKAEAMRRIMEKLPQQQQVRPTITDQSLSKIEQARQMSLTSDDPNDPLNQMMRYGFYKDLKKDFKKGDEERMSTREMMEMAILQRMLPGNDNGNQSASMQQIISDMKAENEKNRLFYEQKLKEQDDKIREMLFEKRIQTMEDKQAETVSNLSQQLSDLNQRIELYQNIPSNPSPTQAKDAISELEDIGGKLDRIKKALSPFGIFPSQPSSGISSLSAPSIPGADNYKNADGSMDYFRYTVDKLESTIGKVTDAWQKKTPDKKQIADTPPPEDTRLLQQPQQERALTPEEYADVLMSKPGLTSAEQEWLANYSTYLQKLQSRVAPRKRQLPADTYVEQPAEPIYEQPGDQTFEQPKKKSALERMREQEEEILRNTQGIL